ncbi:MAG: TIGR02452 family protein, partial [Planctomycetes bacterium]|nr:TIGR02452 family protein [Planctomycetota bacterium]
WMKRITSVLALAIVHRVRHLVLGAWGCGAFGNDPLLVARCFRDALGPSMPWSRGFDALTFAVFDQSRHRSCFSAFSSTLKS